MDEQAIKNASKTLKDWGIEAQNKAKEVKEKLVEAKDSTIQYVDENPRKAAMMAAGIGAAVGALVALIVSGRRR